MKIFALILFLTCSDIHSSSFHSKECHQTILIMHIGESNKPLFPFIFSTNNTSVPIERYMTQTLVIVDNKEFSRLEKAILRFDASVAREKSTNYDYFGSCQITMNDSCRQVMDKPYSRETIKRFFKFLLKQTDTLNSEAKRKSQAYLNGALYRLE